MERTTLEQIDILKEIVICGDPMLEQRKSERGKYEQRETIVY